MLLRASKVSLVNAAMSGVIVPPSLLPPRSSCSSVDASGASSRKVSESDGPVRAIRFSFRFCERYAWQCRRKLASKRAVAQVEFRDIVAELADVARQREALVAAELDVAPVGARRPRAAFAALGKTGHLAGHTETRLVREQRAKGLARE